VKQTEQSYRTFGAGKRLDAPQRPPWKLRSQYPRNRPNVRMGCFITDVKVFFTLDFRKLRWRHLFSSHQSQSLSYYFSEINETSAYKSSSCHYSEEGKICRAFESLRPRIVLLNHALDLKSGSTGLDVHLSIIVLRVCTRYLKCISLRIK
jgi:hypothetical protein